MRLKLSLKTQKRLYLYLLQKESNSLAQAVLWGFDTIAAKAVLDVKEKLPEIKLILVLPCENQTRYWKQKDIDIYNSILEKADKVKYLSKSYYDGCMQKRNRHLVDCSSYYVCYLKKQTGGTAYTVDYAKSRNVKIINIFEALKQKMTFSSD